MGRQPQWLDRCGSGAQTTPKASPGNDPALSGLVHQLLNGFAQGLLVNDPAVSGPPVDAHQLPNNPCHDREGPPDGAPDGDEDHGADTDEVGDAGHDRQGMLGDEHSSRQDPSDGHHDISGTEIASSDSADTFVWSDTFSQGDGANNVSADEEHWPQMDAFSEASVLDRGPISTAMIICRI